MYPWGDAPAAFSFAVGDTVYSGECAGRVVSVDADAATISVEWSDGDGAITYPSDATYIRKKMPWE